MGDAADIAELAPAPAQLIERAVEAAREMLGMDVAYVAETRAGEHRYRHVAGNGAAFGVRVGEDDDLEGTYSQALPSGGLEDGLVADARHDPRVGELDLTAHGPIGSYIGVPVHLPDGAIFGTFCCLSERRAPTLGERDVRFLAVLGRLIGEQLEHEESAEHHRRVALTSHSVLALVAALEARDGYTEEHSRAVVELARHVGERLGLSDLELADLEHAALLHDVGKIGVPDAVLRKNGPLDDDEWAQMRRHPEIGERIVASIDPLAHLAQVIRAEHERWDGGGYPDRLAGEAIPLASRILLVCDAYHAMTSDRPYRRRLTREAAMRELEDGRGSQFCPSCAQIALDLIREAS